MSPPKPCRTAGFVGAVAVLLWSARRARSDQVSSEEERVFRAFNNASDGLRLSVWTVMQSGSFGAVPAIALLVAVRRGRAHGLVVATAGTVAWVTTKGLKSVVKRGRPADLLPDVIIRGKPQSGLGYPSGHAAVALTLALASAPGPASRTLAVAVAGIAAGGRLYTGAHLPQDVAGGLALGAIIGGLAVKTPLTSVIEHLWRGRAT